MFKDICTFHRTFKLTYDGPARQLPDDLKEFRIKFMHEELAEYEKASADGDLEGMLDALVDLVYVAMGTAYLQGFPFEEAWDEVQRANMRKVKAGPNGEGSKRGNPNDVVKPEGWTAPDIAAVLQAGKKILVARATRFAYMSSHELVNALVDHGEGLSRSDRDQMIFELLRSLPRN